MKDCGYDISDFKGVAPIFGNLEDLKELIYQCHKRKIKILLDLVINHTSNQCPWFIESIDKSSDKADWYIWHPRIKGKKTK